MSKSGKHKYLNDFVRNGEGYSYRGTTYVPAGGKRAFRLKLVGIWAFFLLTAAATFGCGCIPAPLFKNCFYVILPLTGEIIALCLCGYTLVRLTASGAVLREYVYEKVVPGLPQRAVAIGVLAGVRLVASLVYFLLHGFDCGAAMGVFILALNVCTIALAFVLRWASRGLRFEKHVHSLIEEDEPPRTDPS